MFTPVGRKILSRTRRTNGARTGALARVVSYTGPIRLVDIAIVVITAVLYAVAWPTLALTHLVPAPIMPIVAALAAFPFVAVRTNPALGWAVSAGSGLIIPVAFSLQPGWEYPWQVVHIIVLLTLLFAVSLRCAVPIVAVAWVSTVLLFVADMPGSDGIGWAVGLTAITIFGLLIRWLILSRRQLAKQEEVNDLERTRRTVLEEKAKIARDLHDVVAHHMSLVVVQAQTAPFRLDDVSPSAAAEFDAIGATAREALNEIRGMLGVLRSDGEQAADAPQPGAADVESLLEGSLRAGVRLSWTSTGDPAVMSDAAGLALYRIVQESLSNVARHAPGAEVRVRLTYDQDPVSMEVVNGPAPGKGPAVIESGTGGHGVRGMRDRAMAASGWLDARILPDGGFEVVARLPPRVTPAADGSA